MPPMPDHAWTTASPWDRLTAEAGRIAAREPALESLVAPRILAHAGLADALADLLPGVLAAPLLPLPALAEIVREAAEDSLLVALVEADLAAIPDRDAAATGLVIPFLTYKGFHALAWHRVAHALWRRGRQDLARVLQGQTTRALAVDIHPAVPIGPGAFIDHGTGVVIGETAVLGAGVSILQGVTLGGTGKERGDRHPKIGEGVLLAAHAAVLGNITVGRNAKVGAGSVVLRDVPPCATVAGVPARIVGWCRDAIPALTMDHMLPDVGPPPGFPFALPGGAARPA